MSTKSTARFEYDIEPRSNYKNEIVFRSVKVAPGTGRFHTRVEASRHATSANEIQLNKVGATWRNVERHVRRNRTWPRDWWVKAAEIYNKNHNR